MRALSRLGVLLSCIAMASGVAACGGSGGDAKDEAATGTTTTTAASSTGDGKPVGERTIAIMNVFAQSEVLRRWQDQIEATANRLGWNVVIADGAGTPAKIKAGMQTLLSRDPDAILTLAVDPQPAQQEFDQANRDGIPIIGIGTDNTPENLKHFTTYIGDGTENMGRLAARWIAENLVDGRTVVTDDNSQNYSGHQYSLAVRDEFKKLGVEVAETRDQDLTDPANSLTKIMEALLQKHKGPLTFAATPDYGNPIYQAAIDRRGRADDVKIVSRYDVPATTKLMRAGKQHYVLTTAAHEHIFEAFDRLLQHWVDEKPLRVEPHFHEPQARVVGPDELPESGDVFPFEPALDEQVDRWSETYAIPGS